MKVLWYTGVLKYCGCNYDGKTVFMYNAVLKYGGVIMTVFWYMAVLK